MMFTVAQTNLQLYNQLREQRRSADERTRVHAAYELAMQLFPSQFRASGKPFLAHLVGVASILAWLEQPVTVVIAGLLHSAYEFGDFGDAARGLTPARQRQLEGAIGREANALIARYQQTSRVAAMQCIRAGEATSQQGDEAFVLLIHLADTVEEYADGGLQYAPGKSHFFDAACGGGVAHETLAGFALLGFDRFVPDLASVFEASDKEAPPAEMLITRRGSFALTPASSGERFSVRCLRIWRKVQAKLHRRASRHAHTRRAA